MINKKEEGSIDYKDPGQHIWSNANCCGSCCCGSNLIHLDYCFVKHLGDNRNIVEVELLKEYALKLELRWQLTSETMRPSLVLSFVRLAVLLKTLLMPISGRRLWRGYDCSSLNFGKVTSSLLHINNA